MWRRNSYVTNRPSQTIESLCHATAAAGKQRTVGQNDGRYTYEENEVYKNFIGAFKGSKELLLHGL